MIEPKITTKPLPSLPLCGQLTFMVERPLEDGERVLVARVRFLYDEQVIVPSDPRPTFVYQDKRYARDKATEAELLKSLLPLNFIPLRHAVPHYLHSSIRQVAVDDYILPVRDNLTYFSVDLQIDLDEHDFHQIMEQHYQTLASLGWALQFAQHFPYRPLLRLSYWLAELHTDPKQDWFELTLGVDIGGHSVNLLPMLVQLLSQMSWSKIQQLTASDEVIINVNPYSAVVLTGTQLKQMIGILQELHDKQALTAKGRLRLSRFQAGRLAELDERDVVWRGYEAKSLHSFGRSLSKTELIEAIQPPQGLQAQLRDYQCQGLSWLQFLREFNLGGVLADDMGLGKTIQTLAHLLVEYEAGRLTKPVLIVVPTSLLFNWQQECQRFTPNFNCHLVYGKERLRHLPTLQKGTLLVTSYPLLLRDLEHWKGYCLSYLILDEAHMIKNTSAQITKAVKQLNADNRLCLTGTPLENHLGELWSIMDFLMPGILGSLPQFNRQFRVPVEKEGSEAHKQALMQRLKPFMLRRTKDAVVKELPPLTTMIHWVEFDQAQNLLYEEVRLSVSEQLQTQLAQKSLESLMVLDALLKLRQVCCDPRLLPTYTEKHVASAKFEALFDLIPSLLEQGRRILIFSSFTSMLALIADELQQREMTYALLTGQTKNRQAEIDKFQQKQVALFLISLKAGGTGLNLTAADTVIHYDPWWNPAAEAQANSRAHRIGQLNPVFIYKLITKGTVEAKILDLQARKQALLDTILAPGTNKVPSLSGDELTFLLS